MEVLAPQWVLTASHCAGRNPTGARAGVPKGRQQDAAIRYASGPGCAPWHGTSGAALLGPDGTTVAGIHNTHNDSGEQCSADNPCEVDSAGAVTSVPGRGYGQQVAGIAACLKGSEVDLTRPGCPLTGA
ncbi:hypothetical protein AMES_2984 [Amycolatopsis mediterranei S699]|uniref:Uncharacterized protein n=2 Tax=Amycolatopsis mediterranei TaxID=33910 RepID=A0A0H3D2E7_AMYMU|nr:hypothetical protein [Amycolatopsis mediterranei]ADJ44810.1 conserved hypothetical protein [Amycolatopsis mediterranei U32]AEK41556.1 hypothetical protein RAM_15340 [Amycolatopsis mediterranei S699]AFO76520.1 hypothetical protein AMES_2984 [Amycolatopsis mediterranei S699]AGT83649.1 hypothetical protein B737_2985 [Amycolatopsis mediterranei RB]KDO07365.1 hypothetical protein DV26_29200 [Amycolatopsis mediterranei]